MAREIGWDDDGAHKSAQGDRIERYKAEAGRRDIGRIVSTCIAHKMHYMRDKGAKGVFCGCGLNDDGAGTCLPHLEKNDDGSEKYPVQEKYGCLFVWIAKKVGSGDWQPVNEMVYWGFGADKYKSLYEFREDHGDLKKIEILISCSDTKFQRLNFSPWTKDSMLDAAAVKPQVENAKIWLKRYTDTPDLEWQQKCMGIETEEDLQLGAGPREAAAAMSDDLDAGADPVADVNDIIDDIGDIA